MVKPTDHEECGTECDACTSRIEAGQPVHAVAFRGGKTIRICDHCETNVDFVGPTRVKTATWSCPCAPCAASRLLRQLVASVMA